MTTPPPASAEVGTAQPGRPPLATRGLVWRVVVLAVVFAGAQPVIAVGLTGVELAGSRYGFWWVLLLELPFVLVAWWVLARVRLVPLVGAVAGLVAVGTALMISTASMPTADRVELTADSIPVPADWVMIENSPYAVSMCFRSVCIDGYPSLTRTYSTPLDGDAAHALLAAAIDAQGWQRVDGSWVRGPFTVAIDDRDDELSLNDLDALAWNRVTLRVWTTEPE